MKVFWGILLSAVLMACSSSAMSVTSIPTVNSTGTSTVSFNPTPEIITSKSTTPRVETIEPIQREVKLSDLGLNHTTRLVLYHPSSENLLIMSGKDVQPQEIPNITQDAYLFSGIEMSPNQNWFLYKVSKGMKDNIAYFDYWLSSIDGKEQKIVIPTVSGGTEVRWVTNEQIELWYYPDGQRVCPIRQSTINPFTQETSIPPKLPPSIKPHCFFTLSMSPDRSKMVYLNENGFWSIHDFNTDQSQTVFPWFSKTERFALRPRYMQWSENSITLVLPRPGSIDFILDLPVSDVMNINTVLNKVLLPEEKKLYNGTFSWWALDNSLVGFDLIDSTYDYSHSEMGSPSSNFVIFDFKNSVWYDYNLDRATTGENQKVISSFVFASLDNRFLAWTIYEPPDMSRASETVILDRETGRIARISGFEFLGWGEMNQP